MSGNGPPTYYQLAITRRQLLGAVAVLGGLLLAVFTAGMWLGLRHLEGGGGQAGGSPGPGGAPPIVPGRPVPELPTAPPTAPAEPAVVRPTPPPTPSQQPPSPTPRATPAPSPTAAPRPLPTAAPSPLPAGWYVQLMATTDPAEASALVLRLEDAGLPVTVLRSGDDPVLHRVRVGPYEDHEEAERVGSEVGRRLGLEPWVTR